LWFVAGLGYFAVYARKKMIRSPEEAFALGLDARADAAGGSR
jgi:hypothetical protein